MTKRLFYILLLLALANLASAEVRLPKIFGNDMVIQRGKPLVIWGWSDPGENITVGFLEEKKQVIANKGGQWRVDLSSRKAGGPYEMTITGTNKITLQNIMIGDVWLCSGQSNMQWTNNQIEFEEVDTTFINYQNIRLFTVQVGTDYLPKVDVDGGEWKQLTKESIMHFSAVAYHFGKSLQSEIEVPIGLINSSLGASSIEAWMSNESLMKFEQFKPEIEPIVGANKNFEQINEEFENQKEKWFKRHYWKGIGLEQEWFKPGAKQDDWQEVSLPVFWENQRDDLKDHNGAVWFRTSFDLAEDYSQENYTINLNQIDDYDAAWINGVKVGETYGRHNFRNYSFKTSLLKQTNNELVVRVFDVGGYGGFTTARFWGNPLLWGKWKYKKGVSINPKKFKKPNTVNVSPFSSPAVLFNANIAPLTDFQIKGVIWYQGESNAERAEEYASLFPAMIKDWRNHFNDPKLPFSYVQLANFMQEQKFPKDETWPELRDAQDKALDLENVEAALAIDVGEADDIHPKNKIEVGRRLALTALKTAYGVDTTAISPRYVKHKIINGEVHITFDSKLITKDKYGFIRGFALAGSEKKFHWAKARFEGNKVVVYSEKVKIPVSVRYAWSANPGPLDLYSEQGLPVAPFRSDDWEGITTGIKFDSKAARF